MESDSIFNFSDPLVAAVVGAVVGSVSTWLFQYFSGRRGLFTYVVQHFRIGTSGSDPALGTITVIWNETPVKELFLSTIELRNNSFKDYENVHVRVYAGATTILTDRTEIVGTTRILSWTDEFLSLMLKKNRNQAETDIISSRRDYTIPIMNRGQEIRFTILNIPMGIDNPTLWIDILHKGIRVRHDASRKEVFGVSQNLAAIYTIIFSAIFLALIVSYIDTTWIAAILCLSFGLVAQLPSVLAIRAYRRIRAWIGG